MPFVSFVRTAHETLRDIDEPEFLKKNTASDYDVDKIYSSLIRAIENSNINSIIKSGEKVLIKPNLLLYHEPYKLITTHPAVIEAVGRILIDCGAKPSIGDSPGGVARRVDDVYTKTGISMVAKKLGIPLITIDTAGTKSMEMSDGEKLYISSVIDDFDAIVNLPKFKTHSLLVTTLAVKNLYGLVQGFQKSRYHKMYFSTAQFSWLLANIYECVRGKVRFGVMDAIWGMEGNGPSAGKPIRLGWLAVFDDCASADYLFETLVGISKPTPLTRELMRRGLVEKCKIFGDIPEVTPIKLPSIQLYHFLPPKLVRAFSFLVDVKPRIIKERCIKCGVCAESCPVKCIVLEPVPMFDYRKCIRCMCCLELCPVGAIELSRTPLTRFFIR